MKCTNCPETIVEVIEYNDLLFCSEDCVEDYLAKLEDEPLPTPAFESEIDKHLN